MGKEKKNFTEWLIDHHNVRVRDFNKTCVPWLWRKFDHVGGLAVRGKDIFIRHLKNNSENQLERRLLHELKHISRQRKRGWISWLWAYRLQSFRRKEEVMAYTRNMEWYFIRGSNDDSIVGHYAKAIARSYRLNRRQEAKARYALHGNWGKIKRGEFREVRDLMDQWKLETGQRSTAIKGANRFRLKESKS